ncbi:MAG: DUF3071 domain-containing protein [Kineosporiaceae bacterium]|nr:DUF3071 domain-containing protein [Kineosporiaceae bacterium]
MQDLTLVGVHDDGEHLVLAGAEGQRFRVRVDEPLRAAVRRDRPRLGQLQIEQDGRLRPRDIQARIRSGESAEQIAADSGVAIEHIRRYEGPVLAEREFVVRQARAVRLRGVSRLDGTVPTLGELVTERLAVREVEHGEGSWDAWRTEDGTWIVTLGFTAGTRQRQAQWAYNAQLRHVTAQDDEARWLTENETPGSSPGAAVHRRLVPLRAADDHDRGHEHIYDVEADGGVRQAEPPSSPAAWPAASTVDLLDTLRERRGRRQRPLDDLSDFEDDGLPPAAHPPRSRPDEAMDAEVLTLPESPVAVTISPVPAVKPASPGAPSAPAAAGAVSPVGVVKPVPVVAEPAAEAPTPPPPPPPPPRRSKRASVPSWDDIVFGGRRE